MGNLNCIYCGSNQNLTKDHVPPKGFFPDPKPSNLITVDCCRSCNKSFEKDDEYLLYMMLMRHDVAEHKSGKILQYKFKNLFTKISKYKFAKSFANKTTIKDVYTPAGIYLGKAGTYSPDSERIIRFMKRITSGIFNYETKRILPFNNKFVLLDIPNFFKQSEDFKKTLYSTFEYLTRKEKKVVGDDVFSYSFTLIEDNENAIVYFFSFFECVQYFTISIPQQNQVSFSSH